MDTDDMEEFGHRDFKHAWTAKLYAFFMRITHPFNEYEVGPVDTLTGEPLYTYAEWCEIVSQAQKEVDDKQ